MDTQNSPRQSIHHHYFTSTFQYFQELHKYLDFGSSLEKLKILSWQQQCLKQIDQ